MKLTHSHDACFFNVYNDLMMNRVYRVLLLTKWKHENLCAPLHIARL